MGLNYGWGERNSGGILAQRAYRLPVRLELEG